MRTSLSKSIKNQGGRLCAFEAFFHHDQSACCWLMVEKGGMFEVRRSFAADAVNRCLERVATGLHDDALDVAMHTHPQTFAVEAAALKMTQRLIKEKIGGVDGWEQVYDGPLCLSALEGRETISPFGEKPEESSDNPVEEPKGLFAGSDDDFAARRRAKRARRQKQQMEALEAQVLTEEGKTKIRAFHSSQDLKNVGRSVALVEVWAVPVPPIIENVETPSPDMAVGKGKILNNNNMYATIVAYMRPDSPEMGQSLLWYYGNEAPIYIGRSEAQEHGGSNVER